MKQHITPGTPVRFVTYTTHWVQLFSDELCTEPAGAVSDETLGLVVTVTAPSLLMHNVAYITAGSCVGWIATAFLRMRACPLQL